MKVEFLILVIEGVMPSSLVDRYNRSEKHEVSIIYLSSMKPTLNPYPTAFPYGNGMVPHFYQQQESSTTKTVHKVNNKGLKTYV